MKCWIEMFEGEMVWPQGNDSTAWFSPSKYHKISTRNRMTWDSVIGCDL